MKEKTLLRIALIASILGLAILFFLSRSIEVAQVDIGRIESSQKGNSVKVFGTVESVRVAGESQIITVSQPSSITVFISDQTSLKKGDLVEVIGRVDEYKEKPEITADRIRVVQS